MNFKTILPRLYLPFLMLLCAAYAWRPLEGGSDLWAHAAVGKWIWANQRVPREALFLWSEPNFGWVAHSWLSELFFFSLLAEGGPRLVVIFTVGIVALIYFLLWRMWKREAPLSFWVPIVFALAIWVSAPRFLPRPELISALFLVFLLAFLVAWQSGRFDDWLRYKGIIDASLVAIPVVILFFLWVNLHAMAGLGFVLLLATVVGDGAQALVGKDRFDAFARSRARVLLAIGVLCAGALLCNPYGIDYLRAFAPVSGTMFRHIDEWKPFWASSAMYDYAIVEGILFLLAFSAWLANPQRRWAQLIWLIIAALSFVQARRMLWLASIVFLVVMAANARYLDTPSLWRRWRQMSRGDIFEPVPVGLRVVAQAGAALCLLIWMLSAFSRHRPEPSGTWNRFVQNVPEGAARYLSRPAAGRRIFNDYEHSSYLQWRLNGAPQVKISARGRRPLFIDLLNAYPDRLLMEYFAILDASPAGIRRMNARRINCIVLGKHQWNKPLVKYLNRPQSQWKLVWNDRQSKIWLRQVSNAR